MKYDILGITVNSDLDPEFGDVEIVVTVQEDGEVKPGDKAELKWELAYRYEYTDDEGLEHIYSSIRPRIASDYMGPWYELKHVEEDWEYTDDFLESEKVLDWGGCYKFMMEMHIASVRSFAELISGRVMNIARQCHGNMEAECKKIYAEQERRLQEVKEREEKARKRNLERLKKQDKELEEKANE